MSESFINGQHRQLNEMEKNSSLHQEVKPDCWASKAE